MTTLEHVPLFCSYRQTSARHPAHKTKHNSIQQKLGTLVDAAGPSIRFVNHQNIKDKRKDELESNKG